MKVLHLPSTVTNLTILNQKNLTDFVLPSYSNVSTLRIENTPVVKTLAAINSIQANSRVRLVGVDWTFDTPSEIFAIMDKLDTFRGLDEQGGNRDKAVVSGVIHVDALTDDELVEMNTRYPNITIDYTTLKSYVRFYDGETLISETLYAEGETIIAPENPTKESTAQYDYPFEGWSIDGENVVEIGVVGNESVNYYAVFSEELRYYTVRFLNGNEVLQSSQVAYGGNAIYNGSTPTKDGEYAFKGFVPTGENITEDTDCYAQFVSTSIISRKIVERSISGDYVNDRVVSIGAGVFNKCNALTSVNMPNVISVGADAFRECSALTSVDLSSVTSIGSNVLMDCQSMLALIIRNEETVCSIGSSNLGGRFYNGLAFIYVPSALIEQYKSATNWSARASQIRALEDYTVDGTTTGELDPDKI